MYLYTCLPVYLYLLNISGMMHTVPKVSSKNMVKAQTFGTFPRFFEKIRLLKQIRMQQFRQLLQTIHQTRTGAADEIIVNRENLI